MIHLLLIESGVQAWPLLARGCQTSQAHQAMKHVLAVPCVRRGGTDPGNPAPEPLQLPSSGPCKSPFVLPEQLKAFVPGSGPRCLMKGDTHSLTIVAVPYSLAPYLPSHGSPAASGPSPLSPKLVFGPC